MEIPIERVRAREILDSRGNPTLHVEVSGGGYTGAAAVPSGASTGRHEALELRDGDRDRYGGRGVLRAVGNVEGDIARALRGMDATDQASVDRALVALDGTPNRSRLGANALVGVSMAVSRLGAAAAHLPLYRYLGGAVATTLPTPFMNVLNGGVHADSGLAIQEFMIVPLGAPSFAEAVRMGAETYHALRSLLAERGLVVAVGDEGGFAPRLDGEEEALKLLVQAIEAAGHRPGQDIGLAIDGAADNFGSADAGYTLRSGHYSGSELVDLYATWADRYPLVSIEDGVNAEDEAAWQELTRKLGGRLQLVGDDNFVTQKDRVVRGIDKGIANAVLLKVNQVGTVTETVETARAARRAGYGIMVSHRSGETEDAFIADLAVALDAGQIKTGALARSERLAKYNRLIGIESELGAPVYAGRRDIARRRAG